ncbi:MAG: hypothetical protein IT361_11525 [Gemmatimonadaceae bacterium]|nr:hypothetical protein [Gemmatimonadaceae bacterium]
MRLRALFLLATSVSCADTGTVDPGNPAMFVVETIALGDDSSSSPTEVTLAAWSRGRLAIADKTRQSLFVYAQDGRLLWRLAHAHDPLLAPPRANALSWDADTLLVADVNAARGVWMFGPDGSLVRRVTLAFELPVTAVARHQGDLLVATTSSDSLLAAGEALLVHRFDQAGKLLASGCRADSLYVASVRRDGMMAIFRAMTAVSAAEGTYCTQPLSPVLRLLSDSLQVADEISLLPWMRAPGADVRGSMDLISISEFRKTASELQQTFLSPGYTHSLLARFDEALGGDRYMVVRCQRARPHACTAASSLRKVIGVISDDTVVALDARSTAIDPQRIALLTYPPK